MHELVLHSYRRCPFAIRVRMTLEEKSLAYRVIEEKLSDLSPELLRLHPEGRVPLLIHRGVAIYESSIIDEYLDESFPSPPLRPQDALGRAQIQLWTYWCNELFKPDIDIYKYEWDDLTEEEKGSALNRMRGHLGKLEVALAEGPYLMGREFTLADIHLFPFYRQVLKVRPESLALNGFDHLDAWLHRIISRPSFERVMAKVKVS